MKRLGVTDDEYQDMLIAQGGVCFICERSTRHGDPALAVDHDHRTGLIRGLLCRWCNFDLLGVHGDDERAADRYERAARYIRDSPAKYAIGYRYAPDSPGSEGIIL